MEEHSVFRGVIEFFHKLGIYDVVLPFLLTFTIFFAILEKTKVFGFDLVDGKEVSKKNINAMVAFVVGFLVVASARMVAIINTALPNIVLLLVISVSFLMLAYFFYGNQEELKLNNTWKNLMIAIMGIGVFLVFAHAIPYKGEPWLEFAWDYLVTNYDSTAVSAIVLVGFIILMMFWITNPVKSKDSSGK
ncbi:MAG: hypothetical protein ACLFPJ_02110 [Candidatus Woesearchaeota archaeon]